MVLVQSEYSTNTKTQFTLTITSLLSILHFDGCIDSTDNHHRLNSFHCSYQSFRILNHKTYPCNSIENELYSSEIELSSNWVMKRMPNKSGSSVINRGSLFGICLIEDEFNDKQSMETKQKWWSCSCCSTEIVQLKQEVEVLEKLDVESTIL